MRLKGEKQQSLQNYKIIKRSLRSMALRQSSEKIKRKTFTVKKLKFAYTCYTTRKEQKNSRLCRTNYMELLKKSLIEEKSSRFRKIKVFINVRKNQKMYNLEHQNDLNFLSGIYQVISKKLFQSVLDQHLDLHFHFVSLKLPA